MQIKTAGSVLGKTGSKQRLSSAQCCRVLLEAMGSGAGVFQGISAAMNHTPSSPVILPPGMNPKEILFIPAMSIAAVCSCKTWAQPFCPGVMGRG